MVKSKEELEPNDSHNKDIVNNDFDGEIISNTSNVKEEKEFDTVCHLCKAEGNKTVLANQKT